MKLTKALGICCAIAIASPVIADLIEVDASKDNTLYEDGLGDLSNGAGSYMFAGQNGNSEIRRAVIHFDVAAAVPAGSTIDRVSLNLNMSRTTSGTQAQSSHRLLADWGEAGSAAGGQEGGGEFSQPGDATWIHGFYNTTPWASAGGDYNPVASDIVNVGGLGLYTWDTALMRMDVQDMLDNPANNFGWIIIGVESGGDTAKRYDSKDNPTVANRPTLTVLFTPPCIGNINGDGVVDTADLGILLGQFGTPGPEGDLNGDGIVDTADLGILLGAFGTPCP